MFPEGRINRTDQLLLPVRPGAAYVALRARVLVVPCYISGAPYRGKPWSPLLIPARVHVVVGDPIDLSPYYGRENDQELVSQLTLNMMTAVARLGGNQEYQPHLASRRWKPTLAEPDEEIARNQRDEHA